MHQPRICAPNSLHFAHALHFAHGGQTLLLSFDCRSDWFWGFCTLPDQNLPRRKTSVLLTRLFHRVLSSNFRLYKEMHTISPSRIAVHVKLHTADAGATYKTLATWILVPVFYSCFILHSILPSIPCLTTNEKNKTKTSITSWQKEKKEIIIKKWSAIVNARRRQKPWRSPGSNRIPTPTTPTRVNRFIDSAKSSSSCFF